VLRINSATKNLVVGMESYSENEILRCAQDDINTIVGSHGPGNSPGIFDRATLPLRDDALPQGTLRVHTID
jgi:hypothetical protein